MAGQNDEIIQEKLAEILQKLEQLDRKVDVVHGDVQAARNAAQQAANRR